MSVTAELLNRLKASNGGLSDYKAAKIIGVTQPSMTKYHNGTLSLSPERVIIVCKTLGLDPSEWLIRLHRERARCTEEISIYDQLLTRLAA